MEIKLKDERHQKIKEQTRKMVLENFDIELSDFQADKIVNFFIKELGGPIYNQGVQDIKKFIQDKLLDLEGEIYIPEK